MSPLRVGLLGCSPLARLALLRPARRSAAVEVCVVASRRLSRAREFAVANGVPAARRSFQEIVDDDELDAVYIVLPSRLHAPWAAAALDAGKHVMVEKPACLTATEAKDLASRARAASRGLYEAVSVATHPWLVDLHELVRSGEVGALRKIVVRLFFDLGSARLAARPPRVRGGGAFRDTAPYWLALAQATGGLAGTPLVLELVDSDGADVSVSAAIRLDNGARAELHASHDHSYEASARFLFDHGELRVPDLFRANVARRALEVERVDGRTRTTTCLPHDPFNAFELQLAAFVEMAGDPTPWRWADPAVDRARMVDALLRLTPEAGSCNPSDSGRAVVADLREEG